MPAWLLVMVRMSLDQQWFQGESGSNAYVASAGSYGIGRAHGLSGLWAGRSLKSLGLNGKSWHENAGFWSDLGRKWKKVRQIGSEILKKWLETLGNGVRTVRIGQHITS